MTGITKYDSAAFMIGSLAAYLKKEQFDIRTLIPANMPLPVFLKLNQASNKLTEERKIQLSSWIAQQVALKAKDLHKVTEEEIAQEMINYYPLKKKYPAIAIGSSNGALVHLYSALGIPWLPQTNLLLVNRGKVIEPDDMKSDMEWGKEHTTEFLEMNPKIALYQMNDPSQDRFMAIRMSYFRTKFIKLPDVYRQFIEDRLEPNGTLIIVNCESKWPGSKIHERHNFQVGGYGGITIDEYMHGGPRVKEFLKTYNSPREKFIVPKPTGKNLEAEWGFDERLREDIVELAKDKKYSLAELTFTDPEDPSMPIAELYRDWYKKLKRQTNKTLVESFLLIDPYSVIQKGLIPYWPVFNGTPSYDGIVKYLKKYDYDYVYLTLFSNIVRSIGIPESKEWEKILKYAKKGGDLIGVESDIFPFDMATPYQFYIDMKEKIPFHYALPQSISLKDFSTFMTKKKYKNFIFKPLS